MIWAKNARRSIRPAQFQEDLPVPQEDHPVAAAGGEGVVGHHQNGGLPDLVQLLQPLQQHPGGSGVQRAGGLVGQHQGGPGDDGPGRSAALLLPAGHLVGVFVQTVLDAQQPGVLLHLFPDLSRRRPDDGQGQGDILKGRQGVQQVAVLKDKAQPFPAEAGQFLSPQVGQFLPIYQDGAGGGPVDGGDTVEQSGLARAGGPHDAHIFSASQGKADPVQGRRSGPPLSIDLF